MTVVQSVNGNIMVTHLDVLLQLSSVTIRGRPMDRTRHVATVSQGNWAYQKLALMALTGDASSSRLVCKKCKPIEAVAPFVLALLSAAKSKIFARKK